MQSHGKLMLEAWREACQHIEIQDFAQTISRLLSSQLRFQRLIVRRVDQAHAYIATVALAPVGDQAQVSEDRRVLSKDELLRLQQWGETGRLLSKGKRTTGVVNLALPSELEGEVLVAPLTSENKLVGVLILNGSEYDQLEREASGLLEKLREPFSVALVNDRRVHEMASLREAAVADRGALLRKLGRTEISDTIVGEDSGLKQVMQRAGLVSKLDVPVLILGETGTGKELVARSIHTRSERPEGPFIRVNCGAIPPELIDSQLFGHERGSFTGADQSRQGWFERADGGTLFLDEVGELPLDAQVRFLRVLQDGFVERVGGTNPIHVNVRIVAATHRDLSLMVREGKFREDLWYRLAVFPIQLPPLRERIDDIPALAQHLAERAALRFGLAPVPLTFHEIRLLQSYDWPGNIRELGAVIDRAAILGDGTCLEVAKALGLGGHSSNEKSFSPRTQPQFAVNGSSVTSLSSAVSEASQRLLTLDEAMREHIIQALNMTHGRVEGKNGAAHILDINPHTLRARMRKLGINWAEFRDETL